MHKLQKLEARVVFANATFNGHLPAYF